jgi:hypothetical protein
MPTKTLKASFILPLLVLALPAIAFAQTQRLPPPQPQTLVVNGQSGQASVVQMNGRSYVDVDSLAQIANGSVAYKANQITLTLPGSAATAPATPSAPNPATNPGFSKGFLTAGIEEMSAIREWRSGIANAIRNSYSVTDAWVSGYQSQAADGLRLASVAATTASDKSALQLLQNALNMMQTWSDQIVAARRNLTYMSPAEINNDPLYQQLSICGHSLAAMAASGQFQDDGSCH